MTRARAPGVADDDGALVARALTGDREAFDALFRRHSDHVYHIVHGVLGDNDLARDVTQDVFVQVYKSLPTFRRGAKFSTWLYRIAVNRAVDAARAVKRRRWAPFTPGIEHKPDPDGDPADGIDARDLADRTARVMQEVPPQHRDVLALRYYRELTTEEMADVLGCSVTAAKVRLHRARAKFRECYERLYKGEAGA